MERKKWKKIRTRLKQGLLNFDLQIAKKFKTFIFLGGVPQLQKMKDGHDF